MNHALSDQLMPSEAEAVQNNQKQPSRSHPRLSVVLITHNEARNIEACLSSVHFADEWVIVDSGSTDNTVTLAQAMGAKVLQTHDWPGFGAQKNRALAMATGDWILSIDADERVPEGLQNEILKILTADADADANAGATASAQKKAYLLPRLTQFCGQWIYHCGWTPDTVLRLFPKGRARFSDDLVHERVILHEGIQTHSLGREGDLNLCLQHYSYPNVEDYWRKLQGYSQAWAKQRHAAGKTTSLTKAVSSGVWAFLRSYIIQLGFMDGAMGLAVCIMQAQQAYGKYFVLYCLGRAKRI